MGKVHFPPKPAAIIIVVSQNASSSKNSIWT